MYTARAPFHPEKLHQFLNEPWPGVVRAKGLFWISSRPDFVGEMSQAGAFVRHNGMGRWWVGVPEDRWPESDEFKQVLKDNWSEDYGDRRQELVFIGLKGEMSEVDIRESLNSCLVEDYLSRQVSAQNLNDPFPKWFKQSA